MCTGIFGKRDIGRIEREMLAVLDWELSLSDSDILAHHANISRLIPTLHHSTASLESAVRSPLSLSPASSVSSSSTGSSPLPGLHHSPASSAASFSPRTPGTPADEPMSVDVVAKSSAHAQVSKEAKRHRRQSSTIRLLRSIHFPGHHHSRHPSGGAA
jgi:hypothetical protein